MDSPIYSFFRNLRSFFGIPHRLDEPGSQDPRQRVLKAPDIYDDTDFASSGSRVQEYGQQSDNNKTSPDDSIEQPFNGTRPGRRQRFDDFFVSPFGSGNNSKSDDQSDKFSDPFGFSQMFGAMDKFFNEFEKEFSQMNEQFGNPSGFGLFNEPILDREGNDDDSSNDQQQAISKSITPYNAPNLRDKVLKPGNDVDDDNDNGGGENVLGDDSNESDNKYEPTELGPLSKSYWSSSSSKFSGSFSSTGEGTSSQAYSQTIRDTPEGREITTYRQNKDGTAERSTEFIPRKDLPNESTPAIWPLEPFGFLGGFFKPRM